MDKSVISSIVLLREYSSEYLCKHLYSCANGSREIPMREIPGPKECDFLVLLQTFKLLFLVAV